MRLVVNLRLLRSGKIGGMENVVRWLVAGLAAKPLVPDQRLIVLCPPSERDAVETMCPWDEIIPVALDETERRMARAVHRADPDLLLCPLLALEPAEPPCPSLAYIPDIQHETFPEFFAPEILAWRRESYAHTVRRADLVLTCSRYSRGAILQRYPDVPPERVVVAPCAADPVFSAELEATPELLLRLGLPGDYLLYPANFWPHKNHSRILQALGRLRDCGDAPFLALTGAPSSGIEAVEAEIVRLGLADRVATLGRLELRDLVAVMRHARAVVFPSLYEGFGLPILEAFHAGAPVLCSSTTSCPEVAGDAALLVDPASVESIADGLQRIWSDAALRADLVAKGRLRRETFDFERIRADVHAALLRLAAAPKTPPDAFRRLLSKLSPW